MLPRFDRQLILYAAVGIASLGAYNLLFLGFARGFALQENLANAAAFTLTLVLNYLGQRFITFRPQVSSELLTVLRYLVAAAAGWLVNQVLFFVGFNVLKLNARVVVVAVSLIVPVLSYALYRWFVFPSAVRGKPASVRDSGAEQP